MDKPLIKIHNIETNEIIEREMDDFEFAQFQADQAAETQRKSETEAKVAARQAILDRLGLSEEEARLLLG